MAYYNANIESDDQIIENFENVIDQLEQRQKISEKNKNENDVLYYKSRIA